MKLWRCQSEECSADPHGRLIFDFAADEPVCPKCGADGRTIEGGNVIVPRACVHLLVKDKTGPIVFNGGRLRMACLPDSPKLVGQCTQAAPAVTCPACQQSELFAKASLDARPVELNEVPAGTKLLGV